MILSEKTVDAKNICTLYSFDGQSIQVSQEEQEYYLNNGWYSSPVIKLYNVGDQEIIVPISEKENYLAQEWVEIQWGYVNITYDVFTKTNLSYHTLDRMLEDTPLAGCGIYFFNMEQQYGVNAVFAIAVAENESSLGKYNANKNNFWGRKSISGGWMSWNTKEESIMDFGAYIVSRYPNMTIDQIGPIYCPNPGGWAQRTKSLMTRRYNKI